MALSLLQDSVPGSGLVTSEPHRPMKDADRTNTSDSHMVTSGPAAALASAAFSGIPHPALLTPGALFHPGALSLHATALFRQHGALFGWRKNNNNVVSSTGGTTTGNGKKSQAGGTRKRNGTQKKNGEPAEPAVNAVAPMTQIPTPAPLSPPTSGSSPPSEPKNGGEKDASRDKVFTCGVCSRSFGYKHVLQNHERTHTGEKPFQCPECHKRFTRDHHLKTHMRLHTGEKPYHCTHCDRQFVQVANLRRHLRVHTGERPYACELCTSRFSDSNQLKAHTLIHKGEKPFQCERCNGRFRRRHHLMHHKCPGREQEDSIDDRRPLPVQRVDEDAELEAEDEEEEDDEAQNNNGAKRKPREIRHVIPLAPLTTMLIPEQTEPEDLSMRGCALQQDSPLSEDEQDLILEHRHPKFRRRLQHT